MKDKITIASCIILNEQDDMLVVRKKGSTFFMLPGGKLQAEENFITTLLRELQEELQLCLQESDFVFLGSHQTKAANEQNTIVEGNIFLLKLPLDTLVTISAEIEEYQWITKENYPTYKLAHLLKEFALPKWLNNFKIS